MKFLFHNRGDIRRLLGINQDFPPMANLDKGVRIIGALTGYGQGILLENTGQCIGSRRLMGYSAKFVKF
jgi:hypothetical protein